MKKEEGITREKLDDIVTAIDSASERFANWLLDNATPVQPNFVGYWRYKKDGKLYTTSIIYKKFKTDIATITQKNELVKADVMLSFCNCETPNIKIYLKYRKRHRMCLDCGKEIAK